MTWTGSQSEPDEPSGQRASARPVRVRHDDPVSGGSRRDASWGSDLIALALRELDIPYVAHVPGSSYAGLHDSIVNRLGNRAPQLILALHEESAVAIAHGYAKASGGMMAAALHANVGLMHASMAIYNAWCDRTPVLLLGATGPWDATTRRSIDWVHTSADQGALVRGFTKWDDQPGSPGAALEALLRAAQIARTAPCGPVYLNLDVALQEARVEKAPRSPEIARYAAPPAVHPAPELVAAAARLLSEATRPVILLGRCSRDVADWNARVALAERLDAPVLTHLGLAAAFPTDHRLHVAPPGHERLTEEPSALLAGADVVLALDWPDLAETLAAAFGERPIAARVIRVSCDAHSHRGWSADHRGLPPADLYLMCETDIAVRALLEATKPRRPGPAPAAPRPLPAPPHKLTLRSIADGLASATRGLEVCYTRLPSRWYGGYACFRHPLDYIGYDGGSGIGSGPGITVGASLALSGSTRIPIGVMGDGDFLMGNTALWTAVHYRLPCLMIVCNNRSFYRDEEHQERTAIGRARPHANKWIGARIDQPTIDIAAMARSLGAFGMGPIDEVGGVAGAIREGIERARAGAACVIDVHIERGREDLASAVPANRLRRALGGAWLGGVKRRLRRVVRRTWR